MSKTDNKNQVNIIISAPWGVGVPSVAAVVSDALRSAGAEVTVLPGHPDFDIGIDPATAAARLGRQNDPVSVSIMVTQEPRTAESWADRFMACLLSAEVAFEGSGAAARRGIVAVRVTKDLADALRKEEPPARGIMTPFGAILIETDAPRKLGEPEPGGPDGDDRVIGVRVGDLRAFERTARDHAFAMVERMRAEDALSQQGNAARLAQEDEDRKLVLVTAAARKMYDPK